MINSNENTLNRDLPTVNRSAMVLELTEAYLQWAKESPEGEPELTLDELCEECSVFCLISRPTRSL